MIFKTFPDSTMPNPEEPANDNAPAGVEEVNLFHDLIQNFQKLLENAGNLLQKTPEENIEKKDKILTLMIDIRSILKILEDMQREPDFFKRLQQYLPLLTDYYAFLARWYMILFNL